MRKETKHSKNPRKSIEIADPEAEEQQMISLAIGLAKQQLLDGTASSQVITHYLKLGTEKKKNDLELRMLEEDVKLKSAKTEAIQATKRMDEVYSEALEAMRRYSGKRILAEEEDLYE